MLIGMLIALLSIAALLSQYRLQVLTSINAMGVAQREGQLATALLTAGQLLQQAGYGIEDASANDSSLLSISDDKKQIIWRFKPDLTTNKCMGLQLDNSGALFLLPETACNAANEVSWTETDKTPLVTTNAATFVSQDRNGQALTDEVAATTLTQAQFQRATEDCTLPYAQNADTTTTSPQISFVTPATETTAKQVLLTACLANIGT